METIATPAISFRQKEIVNQYTTALDKHMLELKAGEVEVMHEIRDFANMLHIHPVHLSNTIKEVTGKSACDLFEERLVTLSKEMIATTSLSIGEIARQLTYDPSNFVKFFKKYTGMTPKKYRDSL
ncbi:DNA-binding protein [Niastella koreensis]|uniref:Transcriptional regulator, AraC family n=2 Tax=Niastella koreensis TaxID=354356 RepID=G8TBZ0_NIAKG|nr:helix-turn-helix transcriptional regulator [Niastella koreensis]AEV99283.1 transcriptional regulator, AraC family [Niastella koreensis GR20-10]OQP46072.1 DNA-binding protein [Niastella koreensis]